MEFQFTPYSIILLVSTLIILVLVGLILRRRRAIGVTPLLLLQLAVAEWSLGAAFEAAALQLPQKVLWGKIAYLGTVAGPLLYFLFAMEYARQGKKLSLKYVWMLSILPAATFFIALTNDWHHLLWPHITLDPATRLAVYGHGPWFWVFVAYNYILLSTGLVMLYRAMYRFPSFYRSQMGSLLIGSALPIAGNIIYVTGMSPLPGLDLTPIAFALSSIVLSWGILKLKMFDLTPIARNQLIEDIQDGVLVLDSQNRIVDINPAARALFPHGEQSLIGNSIGSRLTDLGKKITGEPESLSSMEFTWVENTPRVFDANLSILRDQSRRVIGKIIVLHDVTQRNKLEKEREQLIHDLEKTLAEVKTLNGLLPICASCKKIRDDKGYWKQIENYLRERSDLEISHSICPECAKRDYPDLDIYEE